MDAPKARWRFATRSSSPESYQWSIASDSLPYGVVGIIITWNGSLISLAMKIPAALAAGCTVVCKPSELTPFSAELFMDIVEEAGFPTGVCSILPGDPAAGEVLVVHPKVRKVSFTGGPATASKILHACADTMKPATLELGGKSANIVFDDADLDTACGFGTMMSVGILSGQGCAFPTRMLVQQPIYEDVVARVAMVAKGIPVGDPWDPTVLAGPVINEAALERILGMMERAQKDGARLVTGGRVSAETWRAATSLSRPSSPMWTPTPSWPRTRCSDRCSPSRPSPTRRKRSASPTTRAMACRATSRHKTSPEPSAWPKSSSPARCSSTGPPTCVYSDPSEASASRAWARKAAGSGLRSSSGSSLSASPELSSEPHHTPVRPGYQKEK